MAGIGEIIAFFLANKEAVGVVVSGAVALWQLIGKAKAVKQKNTVIASSYKTVSGLEGGLAIAVKAIEDMKAQAVKDEVKEQTRGNLIVRNVIDTAIDRMKDESYIAETIEEFSKRLLGLESKK